jgi:molybdenum cofactor cytidylyltransferase
MVLLQNGFATLGVPAIHRCVESDSQWITIDEIGYLEAQSEEYHDALRQLLEKKQVAVVVRKQNLPFLTELCNREDAFVVDMDVPFENIGCVIMASGLGKRFGSNKLMADFRGKPMILRALQASESLKIHRVVVTRHQDIAKLCKDLGVDVILHDMPHRSDTVRLGLEFLGNVDGCLFLPGDQPLLRRETIEGMVRQWHENKSTIMRPFHNETPGSPVLFPQWAFPELLDLPEGKGGGWVIKQHPECVKAFPVEDPYQLMDADTPETLELLQGPLKSGSNAI